MCLQDLLPPRKSAAELRSMVPKSMLPPMVKLDNDKPKTLIERERAHAEAKKAQVTNSTSRPCVCVCVCTRVDYVAGTNLQTTLLYCMNPDREEQV